VNMRHLETGVIRCPLNQSENTRPAVVIAGAPTMLWNQSTWFSAATVENCASHTMYARTVGTTKGEK
jgi:hypothetical protein